MAGESLSLFDELPEPEYEKSPLGLKLASLASSNPETIRIVRIVNTLMLESMLVSECCIGMLGSRPGVTIVGQAHAMQFDETDNLLPIF